MIEGTNALEYGGQGKISLYELQSIQTSPDRDLAETKQRTSDRSGSLKFPIVI